MNLLIIDPIVSAVQGDSHKNSETRRALQPLVDLANETGAALLGITHFSKGTGGRDPLERINGSLAFGAMARIVMIAAKPLPQEGNQHPSRIFMRAKSNIGCDEGGHEYDVHQIELDCHPGVITTQVAWGKPIEGTAREFLAEAETVAEGDGGALCDAETFLRDLLAQGAQSVQDVKSAAAAHGHSWRTIERAKKAVNVAASKSGKGGWQWSL